MPDEYGRLDNAELAAVRGGAGKARRVLPQLDELAQDIEPVKVKKIGKSVQDAEWESFLNREPTEEEMAKSAPAQIPDVEQDFHAVLKSMELDLFQLHLLNDMKLELENSPTLDVKKYAADMSSKLAQDIFKPIGGLNVEGNPVALTPGQKVALHATIGSSQSEIYAKINVLNLGVMQMQQKYAQTLQDMLTMTYQVQASIISRI